MKRIALPIIATSSLAAFSVSAMAAELSEARVKELIGQYLKENPEAIVESLQAYQAQEEEQIKEKQQAAVKEVLPLLLNAKHHYGEAGNPKGDIVMIEFFDYNCPACKMMFESIDTLLSKDTNVRVIFADMPIFGPQSDENAKVSMAVSAIAPDKFYRFHQAAMRVKGKVDASQLIQIASNLGVSGEKLKAEIIKPDYDELIAKDRSLATKLQISGTPALIVGETFIGGAMAFEQLEVEVAKARAAKKK